MLGVNMSVGDYNDTGKNRNMRCCVHLEVIIRTNTQLREVYFPTGRGEDDKIFR